MVIEHRIRIDIAVLLSNISQNKNIKYIYILKCTPVYLAFHFNTYSSLFNSHVLKTDKNLFSDYDVYIALV